MLELIIFILSTIGLTFIIILSYLFKDVRLFFNKRNKFIGKLFSCSQCAGFWSGIIIKYIQIFHNNEILDISIILYGFIGSFISYLSYLLIKPLIDKYD